MTSELKITNAAIVKPDGTREGLEILIRDDRIERIAPEIETAADTKTLDAEGRYVAAGFIDLHIQGAGGADVLDGSSEALETIARTCARFGTTGFLATTVYRPGGDNSHLRAAAEGVGKDLGGARLLGIHIEGPFINAEKKGMIHPKCICAPSMKVLGEIREALHGTLRMMTIAPELEGACELARSLAAEGVVPSFGHSAADYEQTLQGFEAGINHVTHLFNAMAPIHHRAPGPLPAIFETQNVTAQVIADGVHLHPRIIQLAFELLGEDRAAVITDGMQAMGLPEGKYVYNGMEYEARDGAAKYFDGTLIGTTLGLNQIVERLMKFTGCSVEAAVKTATGNPARVLGMEDRFGTVEAGKSADLVVLEEDFSVHATIVGGKIVYKHNDNK